MTKQTEINNKLIRPERRKKPSKPKVFNEQRESMVLIESASPSDIYLWCFCISIMAIVLFVCLALALFNYNI